MNEKKEDKKLYEEFVNGNNDSFEKIIRKYKNNLIYYIYGFVKSKEDSEDIFQDVALYIFSHCSLFEYRCSLKTYLYIIAKSKALNFLKTKNKEKSILDENEVNDDEFIRIENSLLEDIVIDKQISENVKNEINLLPKDYKEALYFSIIEDMSYKEIAKIMNKNNSQVKNLIHRGKVKLRSSLIAKNIVYKDNNSFKFVKVLSIVLVILISVSSIGYAALKLFSNIKSEIEPEEVYDITEEDIKYSMQESNLYSNFCKIGEKIVYAERNNKDIYYINLKTNTLKKLATFEDGTDKLYFDGEYVYSCPYLLMGKGIYKIDLEGNVKKIYEGKSANLYLKDNLIYFIDQIGTDMINQTPQGTLCVMDKNGNNKTELIKNVKHYFYIYNNKFYYVDQDSRSIMSANLDGTNKEELAKGRCLILGVKNSLLYYIDSQYGENTTAKDGGSNNKILNLDTLEITYLGKNGTIKLIGDNLYCDIQTDIQYTGEEVNGMSYVILENSFFVIDTKSGENNILYKELNNNSYKQYSYTYNDMFYYDSNNILDDSRKFIVKNKKNEVVKEITISGKSVYFINDYVYSFTYDYQNENEIMYIYKLSTDEERAIYLNPVEKNMDGKKYDKIDNEDNIEDYEIKWTNVNFETFSTYDYSQDMNWINGIYNLVIGKKEKYDKYREMYGLWNLTEKDFENKFIVIVAVENSSKVGLGIEKVCKENGNLKLYLNKNLEGEKFDSDHYVFAILFDGKYYSDTVEVINNAEN